MGALTCILSSRESRVLRQAPRSPSSPPSQSSDPTINTVQSIIEFLNSLSSSMHEPLRTHGPKNSGVAVNAFGHATEHGVEFDHSKCVEIARTEEHTSEH